MTGQDEYLNMDAKRTQLITRAKTGKIRKHLIKKTHVATL